MSENNHSGEMITKDGGGTKKEIPSLWYKEAKGTLVYALSELVFGSLLASFILGFIGFSASVLANSPSGGAPDLDKIIKVLTYLFISGIYTYFTAGLYLFYHTGILTMPTFYLKSAKRDFTLSLLCAVAFGISMLFPHTLLIFLSIIIFCSLRIQKIEYNKFVDYTLRTYFKLSLSSPREDEIGTLKKRVEEALTQSNLDGWKRSKKSLLVLSCILAALGIFLYVKIGWGLFPGFIKTEFGKNIVTLTSSFVIFLAILLILGDVFNTASKFMRKKYESERSEYDLAFERFEADLSTIEGFEKKIQENNHA